jgi:hypothetical protein
MQSLSSHPHGRGKVVQIYGERHARHQGHSRKIHGKKIKAGDRDRCRHGRCRRSIRLRDSNVRRRSASALEHVAGARCAAATIVDERRPRGRPPALPQGHRIWQIALVGDARTTSSSCPGFSRASTFFVLREGSWMAGSSPAMTTRNGLCESLKDPMRLPSRAAGAGVTPSSARAAHLADLGSRLAQRLVDLAVAIEAERGVDAERTGHRIFEIDAIGRRRDLLETEPG